MASWIVHLRVADALLEQAGPCPTEFVMGNLAPDSGVPVGPVGVYRPDKPTSHFQLKNEDGEWEIRPERFVQRYMTAAQWAGYTAGQRAFYLGYYVHLLTDIRWVEDIFWPAAKTEWERFCADRSGCILRWKQDWYDLDFLYLRQNPRLRTLALYRAAEGFENRYIDLFSPTAFEERRQGILDFYAAEPDGLDREYPYLTREEMDRFVQKTVVWITQRLRTEGYFAADAAQGG